MVRCLLVFAASLMCVVSSVSADYGVSDQGLWPKTWPEELESLRKQSLTLEGPMLPQLHYQIPFTTREQFEAAWPHLLKVASKDAPLILIKSPYTRLDRIDAGVFIHSPPRQFEKQVNPDTPRKTIDKGSYWRYSTYIELIVDGKIVDLNRIQLPAETLIIDKRFEEAQKPKI